ncbi:MULTISPECIES: hypothetical protein [Alphaproteobacteria]|uniref:hypothetical protein n=1 Tax=Alphaproteobacteria TaxID=28211 RepID=UPI003265E6EF
MTKTYLFLLLALLLMGLWSASYYFVESTAETQKKFFQAEPKDYPTSGGDEISVDFGK